MQYKRFEELPVWQEAAELARLIYEFTDLEPFRRHLGLRDQLERAALSISNNIAEGFERGTTSELLSFLYIARGSAGEVRSMLTVLAGWRKLGDLKSQVANLRGRSERVSKQLYGWMESLKNSEIPGQRRLDEQARRRYTRRKDQEEFFDELQRVRGAAQDKKKDPDNV
jgi:four helix bundle protein